MRWLIALCLLGAGACSSKPPLANTHPSPEVLARAVLDAVARRHADTLRSLALTEEEFRAVVWPELPAARPERNLPFSYVWGDLRQKSDANLQVILGAHGGHRFQLVDVRFKGQISNYAAYRVHREAVFVVREGAADPIDLRLCGSMIEQYGRWKVFSFVVDD